MARRSGRGSSRRSGRGSRRDDAGKSGRRSGRGREDSGRRGGRDRDRDDDGPGRSRRGSAQTGSNNALIIGGAVGVVVLLIVLIAAFAGPSRSRSRPAKKWTRPELTHEQKKIIYYNEGVTVGGKWSRMSRREPSPEQVDMLVDRYAADKSIPKDYVPDFGEGFKVGAGFKEK